VAHGQWREAWWSNILSPFLMTGSLLLLGYVVIFRFGLARELQAEPGVDLRRLSWIILLVAVALSWFINLSR
jgi:hypothetical protein